MRLSLLVFLGVSLFSCADLGTSPSTMSFAPREQLTIALNPGWYQTPVLGSGHSQWLDYISVQTNNAGIPDSVRFFVDTLGVHMVIPDSIRVINHTDSDRSYVAASFDYAKGNLFLKRFYFPDGYTDQWPPTTKLNLSVFLYYKN